MPDLREWYLAEVDGRLRGRIPTGDLAILLRELETHLYEAHDNARGSGASEEDAQRAAIESLGHPAQIARAELQRRSKWLPLAKKTAVITAFLTPFSVGFWALMDARIPEPFQPSLGTMLPQNIMILILVLWIATSWITGRVSLKPFLAGAGISLLLLGLAGTRFYRDPYRAPDWPYYGMNPTPSYLTQSELKSFRKGVYSIYIENTNLERANREELAALKKLKNEAMGTARAVKVRPKGSRLYTNIHPTNKDFQSDEMSLDLMRSILLDPSSDYFLYNDATYQLEKRITWTNTLYMGNITNRRRDTARLAIVDRELNQPTVERARLFFERHSAPYFVMSLVFLGLSSLAAWVSRRLVPSNCVIKTLSKV